MEKIDLAEWERKIVELAEKLNDPALGEWIKNNADRIIEWYLTRRRMMTPMDLAALIKGASPDMERRLYAASCEKAVDGTCKHAGPACMNKIPYDPDRMRVIPARRWVDCWGWKTTLGMVFDGRSGGYVYERETKG